MSLQIHSVFSQYLVTTLRGSAVIVWVALAEQRGLAHELNHRVGGATTSDGESRTMARVAGRVDGPMITGWDARPGFTITAGVESVRYKNIAKNKYMNENFPDGQRIDRNFNLDHDWTIAKRTELAVGIGSSGDTVTRTWTTRGSAGQWMLGDQLRVGGFVSSATTHRPQDSYLDYDSETIQVRDTTKSQTIGMSLKAILNPTTIAQGEYAVTQSTERPLLRAWSAGIKQFFAKCDCAVHGDFARVINLGALNTDMSSGELTGLQASVAFLKSLWPKGHGRVAYRFAREDEYTRAYGDHLLFGSDSYTAAVSHEFSKTQVYGAERPLLLDIAATRYLHNKAGGATTFEMGAGVKF